jgi:hypothetical protein
LEEKKRKIKLLHQMAELERRSGIAEEHEETHQGQSGIEDKTA